MNTDCIRRFPYSYFKEWGCQSRATTTSSADPVSMISLKMMQGHLEWPNFNVLEHSHGGSEEIHKEIQPHPMSRLGLGTSQTLNSGICYGKRKSPTRISWTTICRQIWQQAQLQLHCYSENKPNITCQTRIKYLKLIRVTELGSASNKETKNAFPLQAWTGPSGSRRLRLPEFLTISTLRVHGSQIYAPAIFTPSPGYTPGVFFC
jgi:hypothetical protein